MSEFVHTQGVFGVSRSVWDHAMFGKARAFSELEAWLWLLSSAVWGPRKVRLGNRVVCLQRGQLIHSLRFLASRWGWSPMKASRFLGCLEDEGMVSQKRDADGTLITVNNYDKYQIVGLPKEEDARHETRQQRDADETLTRQQRDKEKEGKEGEEGKKDSGGADAQPEYAFEGQTVKLTAKDVAQWRKAYPHIVDLMAELQAADDYYTDNPPADGKWYFRVSNWLKRANNEAGEYDRWEEDYYRSVY